MERRSPELAKQLKERKVQLAFASIEAKPRRQLDTFAITEAVGSEHIYETVGDALEAFGLPSREAP